MINLLKLAIILLLLEHSVYAKDFASKEAVCNSIGLVYTSSYVFEGSTFLICKKYHSFCYGQNDSPICSNTLIIEYKKCDIIDKSLINSITSHK